MPETKLSWQPSFSLARKPAKRPAPRRKKKNSFEIVLEHPESRLRARVSPCVTASIHSGHFSDSLRNPTSIAETPSTWIQSDALEEGRPSIYLALDTLENQTAYDGESVPYLDTAGTPTEPHPDVCNVEHENRNSRSLDPVTSECYVADAGPDTATISASPLTETSTLHLIYVPPTLEYKSLTQRFKPILDRYNQEFCTIPLTFQLRINPFRYRTDLDPEPLFLVHAVMALAGHHVKSTSTFSHRYEALQILRQSLTSSIDPETMHSVLDTIVILFSLDETQSMLGNWSTHLAGAYGLIETCGGVQSLSMSSRLEAQLGILTWWDAITSLLSREDCVFPYTYFQVVLSNQHKREWDFFGLCGCPTSLVQIVMRMARLSAARQTSSFTLKPAFENILILEVEKSLDSWCHVPAATAFQDEDAMHRDQDVMHCSEAWRNGLLLYIYRIFYWKPGSSVPMHIPYRARLIVDHVQSCRDGSMMSRQALLPLFFAGCELRDRSIQKEILRLCSVWDERTGYHMFRNTIPLLEEIWAEQEMQGFENVWWGQIVDRHHASKAHPLKMRLCFG